MVQEATEVEEGLSSTPLTSPITTTQSIELLKGQLVIDNILVPNPSTTPLAATPTPTARLEESKLGAIIPNPPNSNTNTPPKPFTPSDLNSNPIPTPVFSENLDKPPQNVNILLLGMSYVHLENQLAHSVIEGGCTGVSRGTILKCMSMLGMEIPKDPVSKKEKKKKNINDNNINNMPTPTTTTTTIVDYQLKFPPIPDPSKSPTSHSICSTSTTTTARSSGGYGKDQIYQLSTDDPQVAVRRFFDAEAAADACGLTKDKISESMKGYGKLVKMPTTMAATKAKKKKKKGSEVAKQPEPPVQGYRFVKCSVADYYWSTLEPIPIPTTNKNRPSNESALALAPPVNLNNDGDLFEQQNRNR